MFERSGQDDPVTLASAAFAGVEEVGAKDSEAKENCATCHLVSSSDFYERLSARRPNCPAVVAEK